MKINNLALQVEKKFKKYNLTHNQLTRVCATHNQIKNIKINKNLTFNSKHCYTMLYTSMAYIMAKDLRILEASKPDLDITLPENNPPQTATKPYHNPCSLQFCENGHCWAPQLAIPHCQGCQNPLIGLKMNNCPVCNEPVVKTQLRIDHLGSAHPITKTCKQEYHIGPEYIFVEIDHKHNTWITKGSAKVDSTQQTVQASIQKLEGTNSETATGDGNGELDGRVQQV